MSDRGARDAIAGWFIQQYHLDHLMECLNAGNTADDDWKPHAGQRAQAKANAERLTAALAADGYVIINLKQEADDAEFDPDDRGWSNSDLLFGGNW